MKTFLSDFMKCGLVGWCMEILFTALDSFRRRDLRLQGVTSLWMFPIYGCAALFRPIYALIRRFPVWARGLTYMTMIFSAEYTSGKLLSRHHLCPWDYSRSRFQIKRLIRLDYAPLWFGAGLFFEKFLLHTKENADHP